MLQIGLVWLLCESAEQTMRHRHFNVPVAGGILPSLSQPIDIVSTRHSLNINPAGS